MKHAFLIIAHHEPEIFSILISLLDHPDCDIYVHIDKKSDIAQFRNVKTKHSQISFIEDRTDVKWGTYTQIQTELKLFEAAHSNYNYSYYHLISGVDLPLKPINVILKWFEHHEGDEFIGANYAGPRYEKRMHRRYFFITRKANMLTRMIVFAQKALCIKWNRKTTVMMGPNWGSLTHEFVTQLLSNHDWIERHFRYSFCGDELYKPTLMKHLGMENKDKGCLRLIDWQRGNPYTWKEEDLEELINSDKLFARKFSSEQMNLVLQLKHYITSEAHIELPHPRLP